MFYFLFSIGEGTCVFSSIHIHLYIFVLVEFLTGISEFWQYFCEYKIHAAARMKMG